jgi:hypothetical protein
MSAGAESPLASGVDSGSVVCCARLGVGSAIVIVVRRDKIDSVIDASGLSRIALWWCLAWSRLVVWEALLELDTR